MTTIAETATLAHGYTMADIERIAWHAVGKHFYSATMDNSDRYDCAWHEIVLELYSTDDPPTVHELFRAAYGALNREVKAHQRHHGRPMDDHCAPNFNRYWLPIKYGRTDGFSERIVETMALYDALGMLSGDQYEALSTLAAFENAGKPAAEALGLKYSTFMQRVYAGREVIKQVWFGDETPPSRKVGQTCKSGHPRAEYGKQRTNGVWECLQCRRLADRRASRRRREAARAADTQALVR